jgi:hypothetical protein
MSELIESIRINQIQSESIKPNKNRKVLSYQPRPSQKKVHESKARWKIICAGRRAGKTILCAGDMINRVLSGNYDANSSIGWIAPTFLVAQRGVEAFKTITKECPELISWYKTSPVTATFPNGVKVTFLSADNPDSLRGYGWDFLVIDESDYLEKTLWDSVIRPSLADKKGSMIAISTPRAKRTFFHKLYMEGLTGDNPNIQSFHFPSSDNPLVTADEIEEARLSTPESTFRKEWLAEYVDDGGSVFQNIDKCEDKTSNCTCKSNTILGIDLAKHEDWTVITSLCAKCRHIKAINRFNTIDWTLQKSIIKNVYIGSDTPVIIIDASGVGDVVYDDLKSEGLNIIPFKFTNQSKQQLINNLRLQIMDGNIKWNPELTNANILRYELECYEVQQTRTGQITYNGRSGIHDDCTISLALAVSGLQSFIHPFVPVVEEKQKVDFVFVDDDDSGGYDMGDRNSTFFN